MKYEPDEVMSAIKECLTSDLLKPGYRVANGEHSTTGHCYVASEALYHLLGGKKAGYKAQYAVDDGGWFKCHWWLIGPDKVILDPTAEQYTSLRMKPPYELGRSTGFLTKEPSKRARTLIRRVKKLLKHQANESIGDAVRKLKLYGNQISNLCFNLKQQCGKTLSVSDCNSMAEGQKNWDAALANFNKIWNRSKCKRLLEATK